MVRMISPKFSYKFKEIISLPYVEPIISVTSTTTTKLTLNYNFSERPSSPWRSKFLTPLEVFLRVWRAFYTSHTFAVQNGPQVKPTTSGIALNNNACSHNQWFCWLMKSLYSSDSMKKKKKNYWLAIRSTYPASNSTDSSHSKGTRKQFLSRIILAQSPCHTAIKAFRIVFVQLQCAGTQLLRFFSTLLA